MKKPLLILSLLISASAYSQSVSPESFISGRFEKVIIDTAVKFTEVFDYKGEKISLLCDVYQAAGDESDDRPVIVWIHGGGFRTGSKRTQSYILRYCTDFAKRGFVCISIDYRLRDSRPEFPSLMDASRDANLAIDWVRKNAGKYRINPDLIFVAGGSAGGMTAITVSEFTGPDTSARFRPESAYKTRSWKKDGLIATAVLWGGLEMKFRDWTYPYLNSNSIPAVLIHGDADKTINVQNSIDLYDAMKKAGISTEIHIMPGAPHTPSSKTTDPQIEDWIAKFFVSEWRKKL